MKVINGGQDQAWFGRGAGGLDSHFRAGAPIARSQKPGGLEWTLLLLASPRFCRHLVGTGCRCFCCSTESGK